MGIFTFWIVLSVAIGFWAQNKGRSGIGFFFLSLLLSPLIGLICVAVAQPNTRNIEAVAIAEGDAKKCPQCAEVIKREALKCRFCGAEQSADSLEKPKQEFYA